MWCTKSCNKIFLNGSGLKKWSLKNNTCFFSQNQTNIRLTIQKMFFLLKNRGFVYTTFFSEIDIFLIKIIQKFLYSQIRFKKLYLLPTIC